MVTLLPSAHWPATSRDHYWLSHVRSVRVTKFLPPSLVGACEKSSTFGAIKYPQSPEARLMYVIKLMHLIVVASDHQSWSGCMHSITAIPSTHEQCFFFISAFGRVQSCRFPPTSGTEIFDGHKCLKITLLGAFWRRRRQKIKFTSPNTIFVS